MTWLYPLFFVLAFLQGCFMRRLGMTRHWGRYEMRLEWGFATWGIFWVVTVLELTRQINYFNLATLFLASLPGIIWGFIPRRQSPPREMLKVILSMYKVIDDLPQKLIVLLGR